MKKFLLVLIAVVLLLPMKFINAEELNLATNAKSAILIEASTGEIIFEKNSHERLVPASMTKMMSMLLIIESIEKGIISWDEMVTVSENASKGIAVASGNDVVVTKKQSQVIGEEITI